jgi:hypothetical protein
MPPFAITGSFHGYIGRQYSEPVPIHDRINTYKNWRYPFTIGWNELPIGFFAVLRGLELEDPSARNQQQQNSTRVFIGEYTKSIKIIRRNRNRQDEIFICLFWHNIMSDNFML